MRPTPVVRPRARTLALALLALLPWLAGCAAQQGVITGRVVLEPPARETAPMPAGAERDPRAAVVYLESIPDSLASRIRLTPGPDAVTVEVDTLGFHPRVVAMPVGGSVVFRVHDRVFHHPFMRAEADSFDTGPIRPRESRVARVSVPGRYLVFCMLHPGELGILVVTPTRVLAQPKRDGEFKLPALPFGHYTLHAWHPAFGEIRREVELRDPRGARIELMF